MDIQCKPYFFFIPFIMTSLLSLFFLSSPVTFIPHLFSLTIHPSLACFLALDSDKPQVPILVELDRPQCNRCSNKIFPKHLHRFWEHLKARNVQLASMPMPTWGCSSELHRLHAAVPLIPNYSLQSSYQVVNTLVHQQCHYRSIWTFCLFVFHTSGLKKEQSKFTLRLQNRRQLRRWPIPTPHKSNHLQNRRRARAQGLVGSCRRQMRWRLVGSFCYCASVHGLRSPEALLASA